MTPNVAIIGTTSSHGGHMVSASGSGWVINGNKVCLEGDLHWCPIAGHGTTAIVSGCTVKANVNGKPVAINGSVAGCGAVLDGNFSPGCQLT